MDLQDGSGRTALHWAATRSQIDILKCVLGKNCEVNLCDSMGWTALHCAVSSGAEEVVEMLLEKGALVNAKTNNGQVPLHYAASKNHTREEPKLSGSIDILPFRDCDALIGQRFRPRSPRQVRTCANPQGGIKGLRKDGTDSHTGGFLFFLI